MRRRIVLAFFCAVYLLTALPVEAQTSPAGSDRATGENYRVEIGGFIWNPDPQIAIQSQALGIVGTRIDFIDDLGLEQTRFNQLKVVLRPATKHKFRFEYTPINYEQPDGILKRNITFNGISYNVALPVSTTLKWNAFRFGYEWDFVYQDRGFVGLVLEAKYTDVEATLSNVLDTEYVRARAPIPAIGVIGRVYPAANISITGEFSAFKLPESIDEDYRGSFYDFDLYGTININDHVGGQIGYRTFSVFYHVDDDEGEMKLRGLYFGGVFRF
jgi:hypothetical protein